MPGQTCKPTANGQQSILADAFYFVCIPWCILHVPDNKVITYVDTLSWLFLKAIFSSTFLTCLLGIITKENYGGTTKPTKRRAPCEDSDQPGHQSVQCLHCAIYGSVRTQPSPGGQRRLWSDWADAKDDLSLRWAHRSFCFFCRAWKITKENYGGTVLSAFLECHSPAVTYCRRFQEFAVCGDFGISSMDWVFLKRDDGGKTEARILSREVIVN